VLDLWDMTGGGNYTVRRTLTYPEHPNSQIVFETEVTAASETEWSTRIAISGTYDGPTDVVGTKDYRLEWTTDGKALSEKGSATLELSSGGSVRSVWTSVIVPAKPNFERFASGGEVADVTFSPFKIDGNKMTYDWQGTARAATAGH